ncbi:MAG: cytochrome c biogenesis protein CcsA [Bdellovibrionota bacterium]
MTMISRVKWFGLIAILFTTLTVNALPKGQLIRALPVQDGGRIKPFDSFALETLELIHGKSTLNGKPAYEVVMTWLLAPQAWEGQSFFHLDNHEVKKELGLPKEQKHFTGQELFGNEKFSTLRQELENRRQTKEKLTPYYQAIQRMENQYVVFSEIASGNMFRAVPPREGTTWVSLRELSNEFQVSFLEMSQGFLAQIGAESAGNKDESEAAKEKLDQNVEKFMLRAWGENTALYPELTKPKLEVYYNIYHPFRWAYVFYLLAAVTLLLVWIANKQQLMKVVWSLAGFGFFLHVLGFAIRCYLAGRPPVTNMYETVVWVAFGAIIFGGILEMIYKFRFTLLAGLLVGVFSLVIADVAPAILDPSLQPLEPVLRSNYWLIIHVMTITISYAAFFLAFMLGDIALIFFAADEIKNREKIKPIVLSIYRAMQIGVAFIAPGIILGGVWADYSWGRFWGWDPKETWALIVLLGYIAVLHGRLVGWIKDFGMAASGVLTFSMVIMAWYGVNFVLGAGLHSYGFGAGGVEYVGTFVLIHLLFVLYVWITRNARMKIPAKETTKKK